LRATQTFHLPTTEVFKKALLRWADSHPTAIFLDSNQHANDYANYEALLAVGVESQLEVNDEDVFEKLREFKNAMKDWLFGYFSYDVKNGLEDLESNNYDNLDFANLHFFQPKKVIALKGTMVEFHYLETVAKDIPNDFKQLKTMDAEARPPIRNVPNGKLKMRIHKGAYHQKAERLLAHIQRGDVYEANLCQEFYIEQASIDPLNTFQRLNSLSEAPFSTYMKMGHRYLLCASPERYLRRQGQEVIAQPIKGTAARSQDEKADRKNRNELATDEKERAENIMIVDLVRNDLSKQAVKGSVSVKELCEVYTFRQVHQMISTIACTLPEGTDSVDVIKNSFPMGSMTGAPKVSAMKLIEELEETKRGLYSGSVGYFKPNDDFDFNVVIRSILFNAKNKYVSFIVGSAFTAKSVPEKEFGECLLKAKAMRKALDS